MPRRPRASKSALHARQVLGLTVFLGAPVHAAMAAEKTVAHLEGYWVPDFEYRPQKRSLAQVFGIDAGVRLPIALSKGIYLTPAATYHLDGIVFDAPPNRDFNLHAVDLSVEMKAKLPKNWTLKLSLGLGLAGDFRAIDAGVLRGHGFALATYALAQNLSLGGGIYASYAFGSFLPLPAFALLWHPSNRFTLDLLLPDHISAVYHARPRINLSASIGVGGQKYAIRSHDRCSLPAIKEQACLDNAAFSLVGLEIAGEFRTFSSVWLKPYLGLTLYRRFDMYTTDKTPLGADAEPLTNGPYLGLRAEWKMKRSFASSPSGRSKRPTTRVKP